MHSKEPSTANASQSIFSPHVSPWDQVFEDIKDIQDPRPPTSNPRSLKMSAGLRARSPRQQTATARETEVLTDMFSSVFSASSRLNTPGTLGIGRPQTRNDMKQLYGKLRSHTQRLRWTTEADQELDRKKEEMELLETDVALLEWAMREVFGESQRYESVTTPTSAEDGVAEPAQPEEPVLHPSSYPILLAALMRTFRDKYKDPNLALSMFDHARHLSISSFVFGCTTPAYNELIETRWRCFRDLRGVVDALEEMRVNGIELDNRTRQLGETVRREVGERDLWQEDSPLGTGEVWELVASIERLTVVNKPRRFKGSARNLKEDVGHVRRRKWSANQEAWKQKVLEDGGKPTYQFERLAPRSTSHASSIPSSEGQALKDALMRSS
ncbi:uncharacterized protein TRAVEDRAFT_34577 [Trametes versicolor FP-101664 SS1]|uniref:uncharacterized protein n=1 Tax=Trametes versicolor (strain FP-101664) TaxID=717944 RepID=UPI0004623648|nr:uncharacterized protein TRAVEDRAFT_34577 [Trametes versicolor FP-101664 SS1]EIW63444.1 hypothetical protein TRAVEDRAFT_34577 [Trametes versicolor FP-101664 SS1]